MSNAIGRRSAGEYLSVDTETGVDSASPHQLIGMLLDGAISKISMAKGAMQRNQIEQKGSYITSASSIVLGLRGSLDLDKGGEIAENLDNLYAYMTRRLMDAHCTNSVEALDEVTELLREIKCGWEALAQEPVTDPEKVETAGGV